MRQPQLRKRIGLFLNYLFLLFHEKKAPLIINSASYGGYNRNLIDQFVILGYDKETVVEAFKYVGIDRNNGEDYTLEEAYQGDILARLSDA